MNIFRTILISTTPLALFMIQGCNSDSAEKFNGEWLQVLKGKGIPDKISISCDTKTCEWRFYSGFTAQMNGGPYDDSPEIKHLVMTDGKLDLGMGRTVIIENGKLYFAEKVFLRSKT